MHVVSVGVKSRNNLALIRQLVCSNWELKMEKNDAYCCRAIFISQRRICASFEVHNLCVLRFKNSIYCNFFAQKFAYIVKKHYFCSPNRY